MEKSSSSSSSSKDGDSAINSSNTNNANTTNLESGKSRSSPSRVAAAGVNEEQHSYGHSTYQDKDDDTFLDEVENTLLGSDSLNGNVDSPGHHGNGGIKANTSRSSTAVNSPRRASSPRHPHSPYYSPSESIQDDPSTFRRKCRAGIFYLICSTVHELVIYKLAQRTSWPIATSFIPFEFLIFTIITGIASLYMKKTSNLKMQQLLGLNGLPPILPCLAWKESAPLAALTVAAAAFRVLKDASLEASISTAVSVSPFGVSPLSPFCPHQLAMIGTCLQQ